jgi:hypothetical protein
MTRPPTARPEEAGQTQFEAPLDGAVARWILGAMMAKNQRDLRPWLSPLHGVGNGISITQAARAEAEAI